MPSPDKKTVLIDNITFIQSPKINYLHDYMAIAIDIAKGKHQEADIYRSLILTDLFFVLYFIVRPFRKGMEDRCNNPWVVNVCREVQLGPEDYTLDVWARESFKSSIITLAETIQYALKYPDRGQGIFSYVRPAAKRFLFAIKEIFEQNNLLKRCFPEIVWQNPAKDAPIWSLDDGIILKRNTNRREATVSAHGLTEGMPTGMHFDRRIYDDIVTEDIADSMDTMEKVKDKFDSSQNLGTIDGTHRVIGTFYHHADPLTYVRDKKVDEVNKYHMRLKPGSVDGTRNGEPVLLTPKRWEDLKLTRSFNMQQLCDPSPTGATKLNSRMLSEIPSEFIPRGLHKFMLIDPAGDSKDGTGDAWAILCVGVDAKLDEVGMSDMYLLDACITPMMTTEAIEEAVRMYIRAGMVLRVGIEKVGLSSVEMHFTTALRARGRHISEEAGTLILLKPRGRNKIYRIDAALSWPLSNGKLHMSTEVSPKYRDRIRMEMDKFPYWHDDGCDAWSYIYDILKDYPLPKQIKMKSDESMKPSQKVVDAGWMI